MPPVSLGPSRAVVVTAAGSGLGHDIALGFAAKGYIVFGTAASSAEAEEVRRSSRGRVSLTVCKTIDGIQAWAGVISDALGNAGIDILVNNTVDFTPGPIEAHSLDAVRHEFEVNVFGAVSVINAFLPALRMAHGRIVQVSSWTASLPLPFNGPSDASKAAIEVLSTVYRAELKPFGIDFVIASADKLNTEDMTLPNAALRRPGDGMTWELRKLYGKRFALFLKAAGKLRANDIEVAGAAARVIKIAEQRPAPIRAAIGPHAEKMLQTVREKSDAELDALRLNLVGLN
jgi:NAD(P)-dependent dehydrogenase (short-subunit alcohol dehydrogenase family)